MNPFINLSGGKALIDGEADITHDKVFLASITEIFGVMNEHTVTNMTSGEQTGIQLKQGEQFLIQKTWAKTGATTGYVLRSSYNNTDMIYNVGPRGTNASGRFLSLLQGICPLVVIH